MRGSERSLVLVGVLVVGGLGTAALASCSAGCSRTGAEVRAHDAGAHSAHDAVVVDDAASIVTIPLSHALVEVVLVIDRSGSMREPMDASGGPTRWEALTASLDRALRAIDAEVIVGGKLYPDATEGTDPASLCATSPGLTVPPAIDGGARLVDRMRRSDPRGGTPTAEAIDVALASLSASPLARHAILLVTDGAPNCNPDTGVPADRCVCSTDPEECLDDERGAYLCLDDARTLGTIARAASAQVPVIVVGIDDPSRPDLARVLDDMAVAGGRPRPIGEAHRFHSARSASELDAALRDVGRTLSACTFVPDGAGTLGGGMTIELDGARIPESATEGWTLSPVSENAVDLHGSYCARARVGDRFLVARVITPPEVDEIVVGTFAP